MFLQLISKSIFFREHFILFINFFLKNEIYDFVFNSFQIFFIIREKIAFRNFATHHSNYKIDKNEWYDLSKFVSFWNDIDNREWQFDANSTKIARAYWFVIDEIHEFRNISLNFWHLIVSNAKRLILRWKTIETKIKIIFWLFKLYRKKWSKRRLFFNSFFVDFQNVDFFLQCDLHKFIIHDDSTFEYYFLNQFFRSSN